MNKRRPKHLALHQIKLPLPGIVSIFHRVSGMLLFLALPFLLLMLQNSLRSDTTFHDLSVVVSNPLVKICLLGVMWGFLHHFCAGLRYLAIDLHYVRNLAQARGSSMAVVIVSLALTIIFGVKLW